LLSSVNEPDKEYLEKWINELGLDEIYEKVKK
jgi:hypothetical protein